MRPVVGRAPARLSAEVVGREVAVFAAGLMIGRTPEYLGKKIEGNEVKMTMLALLCVPACILGMGAVAAVLPTAVAGLNNAGPHGFSELLYAYTSGAATNGSAFAGLNANTPFYNLTLAAAMFAGELGRPGGVLEAAGRTGFVVRISSLMMSFSPS